MDAGLAEGVLVVLSIAIGIVGYFVKGLVADHNEVKNKVIDVEKKVAVQEALIASQDSTIQEVRKDLKELLKTMGEIQAQIAGICNRSGS